MNVMAPSSSLLSLLQLTTGNLLLDMCLSSLIVGLTTLAWTHGRTVIAEMFASIIDVFRFNRKYSVVVPKSAYVHGNGEFSNQHYRALTWYFSHYCDRLQTTCIKMYKTTFDACGDLGKCEPYSNTPAKATFVLPDGSFHDLDVLHTFDKSSSDDNNNNSIASSSRNRNERIVLTDTMASSATGPRAATANASAGAGATGAAAVKTVDGTRRIRCIVRQVLHEYDDFIKHSTWEQRLYRLTFCEKAQSPQRDVVWKCTFTHNKRTFERIALPGCDSRHVNRQSLEIDVREFITSEQWYEKVGLSYKRGYMFHGPPGTGKTSVVAAISNVAKYDIYAMDLSKLQNNDELEQAFEKMPERCLVMFEDVDCMTPAVLSRSFLCSSSPSVSSPTTSSTSSWSACSPATKNDTKNGNVANADADADADANANASSQINNSNITLSALLNCLDGVGSNHGRIYVFTSNRPYALDPALLRSGRIDFTMQLGNCDAGQLRRMFAIFYDDEENEENSNTNSAADVVCAQVPAGVLQPALVSNVMQQNKRNPAHAAEQLVRWWHDQSTVK